MPTRLWYDKDGYKVYEYLGNLALFLSNVTGVPGGTDNVPFVIISDLNNSNSIDVLTSTAGTYTILVEQIRNTQKPLPTALIYGDSYAPILKNNNGGTYNGFSIGVNELLNKRGTFALGYGNVISNEFAGALGIWNDISGSESFAIGSRNKVTSPLAVAMGSNTTAYEANMFVIGRANSTVETEIPEWQPNTQYKIGDSIIAALTSSIRIPFMCKRDHTSGTVLMDDVYDTTKWLVVPSNTAFVIGNGLPNSSKGGSNALKIDWIGNVFCGGDVFVYCDKDSNNGTKLVKESDLDDYAKTDDIITDVQVNGTSVTTDGVAEIPVASTNDFGVIKPGLRTEVNSSGQLVVRAASDNGIKQGTTYNSVITPQWAHATAFFGLAKAAGDITQSASNNAIGTYTDDAKTAIQTMLGVPSEDDVVDDVQVNGTSIVTNGTANIPIANGQNTLGLTQYNSTYGVTVNASGRVQIFPAISSEIKGGTNDRRPITPSIQNESVFYGLAKAAGDITQSSSSNAVGTYTDSAKTAIKQMFGVKDDYDSFVEEVSGTDPVITGKPSYRYNCGELYTLSITPPASGTMDIIFTSGTTPTVLTLPNTVKMPDWWAGIETNTTYEMCITDGTYCGVMSWAT